jgi:hypothetical protein
MYYELGGGVIRGKTGEHCLLHHERNPSTISRQIMVLAGSSICGYCELPHPSCRAL